MVKYWPIWAKKGSELGQNCQNHVMLVRSHNKTFFNLVKGAEQKYFLKFPNFDLEGSQRVKLDPKKSQNWTKKGQNCVHGSRSQNKVPFHFVKGPEHNFSMKFPNFVPQGQILANLGQKSIKIGPK